MVTPTPQAEFDRPVSLDRLSDDPALFQDEANDGERLAIAERLQIKAVDRLSYSFEVMLADKDKSIAVAGAIDATVTLLCSVTLEPFQHVVQDPVALRMALPGRVDTSRDAIPHEELELDEAEALFPEVIEGNSVNLGEMAVEALSLALPDYPRAPGATLPPGVMREEDAAGHSDVSSNGDAGKGDTHRPFAKLAVLKDYQRKRQEEGE
ncbi:MAG: YceD family protein [Pseudomonadota bacterium]